MYAQGICAVRQFLVVAEQIVGVDADIVAVLVGHRCRSEDAPLPVVENFGRYQNSALGADVVFKFIHGQTLLASSNFKRGCRGVTERLHTGAGHIDRRAGDCSGFPVAVCVSGRDDEVFARCGCDEVGEVKLK